MSELSLNSSNPQIAQRLKSARNAAGLTQEEVAERIGVSRTSVAMWESTRRPVLPETSRLSRIEEVYGVSISYILKGANDETSGHVAERAATYGSAPKSLREMAEDLGYMWMSLPDDDRRKIYDQTALAYGLHHVSKRRNKPAEHYPISQKDDGARDK